MDDKVKTFIRTTLVFIAFVALGTAYMNERKRPIVNINVCIPDPNFIPAIEQVQQALKNKNNSRYDPGPIDGKVGPLLKDAWENWEIDKHAIKEFN